MPDHIELTHALQHSTLALFIGADLSREITGLPSRIDLARGLASRYGEEDKIALHDNTLAQVAQRIARGGNRWDFTAFIRDNLDTSVKLPQLFHRRIVELFKTHQIQTLITTAYDDVLEHAFRDAGLRLNRVVRGSDVSFITHGQPTLIKLYGDARQPDTLVVTEDDHYGIWRDRDKEDLLDEVRTVLRRQTVLFLGYNLADPDFNLLWREVLDRAGRFAHRAYAVWPGLPERDVQMWFERGIVILDADPWGILGDTRSLTLPQPVSQTQPVAAQETGEIGFSPNLYQQLQRVLLRCGPFQSTNELSPVFVDKRISIWRDTLPSRDNPVGRVQAVIGHLFLKSNAAGENALVLFLQVLRDQKSVGDACYSQLDVLASELKREVS